MDTSLMSISPLRARTDTVISDDVSDLTILPISSSSRSTSGNNNNNTKSRLPSLSSSSVSSSLSSSSSSYTSNGSISRSSNGGDGNINTTQTSSNGDGHNDDNDDDDNDKTSTVSQQPIQLSSSFKTCYFDTENNYLQKKSFNGRSQQQQQLNNTHQDDDNAASKQQRHPEKERMKRNRRDRTASMATVGGVAGTILVPVVGTVVGAALAGYTTNAYYKRRERHIQQKWERDQYQLACNQSSAATGSAVFV